MNQPNNKSTKTYLHSKTDKKSLFLGGIVVLIVAVSPLIFYLYESFPQSQVWETPFFTAETSFRDWNAYAWYFSGKIVPLILLLLWFFTCRHWWHWIILVPIAMYAFQLWGVINESNSLDELEIYYLFPLMMILVPFVYLIRAKLFNKLRDDDLQSFEEELGAKKSVWQQIKDLFN